MVACPSASAADELVQSLWPGLSPQPDKPPSKLTKIDGASDLLQMVPLVLLPEAAAAAVTGKAPASLSSPSACLHVGLDLLSEVLEGARAEGFSLAGLSTIRPAGSSSSVPGDCLPKGLKLSQAQSQAMKAALSQNKESAASHGGSGGVSSDDGRYPRVYVGTPVVALALSQENAMAYLPMRMQQLSGGASLPSDSSTSTTRRQQPPQGLAAAARSAAPVPGSRMAVEEVLLHFFDVFPVSSGYLTSSP